MISTQVLVLPTSLIGWRNKKGISLSAVAAATNISSRYLEAIERGEFHKLPAGVYRLSYIRQYARAIHFDEHELVNYYHTAAADDPAPATAVPCPPQRSSRIVDRLSTFWIMAKFRGILQSR